MTDATGTFRLLSLVPGEYKLVFTLQGFQTVVREKVMISSRTDDHDQGDPADSASIEEQVTVIGQVPLIDVKSTVKGMTLTKEVFKTLPKGRDFDSLITAIPGVSNETMLGGTSVDGASGLENMYYIDGTDITNIVYGNRAQGAAFDFVDEVQVKASGYQAEFGGSLGGVINVVTRSGGNEFHGEVIGYYSGAPLRTKYRDSLELELPGRHRGHVLSLQLRIRDEQATIVSKAASTSAATSSRTSSGSSARSCPSSTPTPARSPIPWTSAATAAEGLEADREHRTSPAKLTAQPFKNLRVSASVVNNFYKYKGDLSNVFGNPDPTTSFDDYGFSYPNLSGSVSADLTLGNNFLFGSAAAISRPTATNSSWRRRMSPASSS